MKSVLFAVFLAALTPSNIVSQTRMYRNIIVEDASPYSVLGVDQNADIRQIKSAFKKLALKLHPDKNPDGDAKERFLEARNAYEFLKDPEVRSLYDRGQLKFQSYTTNTRQQRTYYSNYYQEPTFDENDDFIHIYKDDPNIVVLEREDFDNLVKFSKTQWFINFFSPMCFHCRQMVHIWKEIAKEFSGVINIGAINCKIDPQLCREENIPAYPFLRLYPSRERFNGYRTIPELRRFILDRLAGSTFSVNQHYWETQIKSSQKDESWLFFFCGGHHAPGNCLTWDLRKKVAAVLNGHANIGIVDCRNDVDWCEGFSERIVYWKQKAKETGIFFQVKEDTLEGIVDAVLEKIPKVVHLSQREVHDLREKLSAAPWLIGMGVKQGDEAYKILKELPPMLPGIQVGFSEGRFDDCKCDHNCKAQFFVFKSGGTFEDYRGQLNTRRIAEFVQMSAYFVNVHSLSKEDLLSSSSKIRDGLWFVLYTQFSSSNFLSALVHHREVSRQFDSTVRFGVVDCSKKVDKCADYSDLCRHAPQTPYSVYYNNGDEEVLAGILNPSEIKGFLEDKLKPLVLKPNYKESVELVKSEGMWIVAYADGKSWCRDYPPYLYQWHTLAQMLEILPNVRIVVVDCLRNGNCPDCWRNGGPCVKVYHKGFVESYGYQSCEAHDVRWWFLRRFIFPVSVIINSESDWSEKIDGTSTWLIYFSATMRDVCRDPTPSNSAFLDFETIAKAYESSSAVQFGCLNCFSAGALCSEMYLPEYPAVMLYAKGSWLPSQGIKIKNDRAEIAKVAAQLAHDQADPIDNSHDEL